MITRPRCRADSCRAGMALLPVLASAADGLAQAHDLVVLHVHVGHVKECGDGLFRRTGEVGAHHVREHVNNDRALSSGDVHFGSLTGVSMDIHLYVHTTSLSGDS